MFMLDVEDASWYWVKLECEVGSWKLKLEVDLGSWKLILEVDASGS